MPAAGLHARTDEHAGPGGHDRQGDPRGHDRGAWDDSPIPPGNLLARALVLAVASAILGAGLVALAATAFGVAELSATMALVLKVAYGAILAVIVTPPGLRRALARAN